MGEGERKRGKPPQSPQLFYANQLACSLWRLARVLHFEANHLEQGWANRDLSQSLGGDCLAREEFKPRVSGIIFPRRAVRVPEVTHSFDWAAALSSLPFALSLTVLSLGGCGHCAQREAAFTNDAWETPLGGHYGAGGTLGGDREPEEGEAKGALRMGRASFLAALAWAGREAVTTGPEHPRASPRAALVPMMLLRDHSYYTLNLEKGSIGLWSGLLWSLSRSCRRL